MSYNNSFGHVSDNENTDYSNTPPNVGIWTATNANGDSCDMYFNISLDPLFLSDSVYTLSSSSHCIDAGDPTISDWDGSVSDMGAFGGPEGNWIVPAINPNSPDLPLTFYKVMK
jgi:hypothetical protein